MYIQLRWVLRVSQMSAGRIPHPLLHCLLRNHGGDNSMYSTRNYRGTQLRYENVLVFNVNALAVEHGPH